MSMMTPEQEAANALDFGTGRSGLSKAAQRVYDRLLQERQELAQTEKSEQTVEIQQSSPEDQSAGPPTYSVTMLVCPKCKRDSHIRKVSGIVAEGTATDLASQLKMPPMPLTPTTGPSLAGSLGLGCLGSWVLWLIIALIGYKVLQFGKSGEPYAIGLIVTVIIVSIIVGANYSSRRQEKAKRVHEETIKWHRMQQVWNDLYYCSRDDIIFLASDPSEFASANLMIAWLAQQ